MNPTAVSTVSVFLLLLISLSSLVNSEVENFGKSFLEDVTMTGREKEILNKFAQRVSSRLRVPYMKEEFYLIRWLRARNFDLDQAERMLIKHLKWWDDTKMDTIENEDWSNFYKDFPIGLEGIEDKEGRPVLYLNVGSWDLRRAAVTGKIEQLYRYICMYIERATSKVRRLGKEKKEVSQVLLIINADEFSVITHGCFQCVPFILRIVTLYENHFPGYLNKFMVFNTPAAALVVADAARGVFHPETNKIFKIYGRNKNQWQPVLQKYMDKSQIPADLGGLNTVEGLDY